MYNYVMLIGTVKEIKEEMVVNERTTHILLECHRPFRNAEGKYDIDVFDVRIHGFLANMLVEDMMICLPGDKISIKGRLIPSNHDSLCYVEGESIIFMERKVIE